MFAELPEADDRITELANELADRYPATAADHDRVVMAVRLTAETENGDRWAGEYALDVVGDETETAISRTVSVPLACGILGITAGKMTPGLHQATDDPDPVRSWLDFLDRNRIRVTFQER